MGNTVGIFGYKKTVYEENQVEVVWVTFKVV